MRCRRKIIVLLIALRCLWIDATRVAAQDGIEVFSDTDLPSLLDDSAPTNTNEAAGAGSSADDPADSRPDLPAESQEELPPVSPTREAPQIDLSGDDPAFDLTPRNGAAGTRGANRSLSTPADEIPATEADLEEGDAEILPQETIQERYPDGRIKVERGVSQDESQNYVNHGPWRMWDEAGNLVAEGMYRFGKRHGKWMRWYRADEAELFQAPPFTLFTAPFRSQAVFRDGQLDGPWTISDSSDLKICDWQFEQGRRHGNSTWYYHTGRPMREIKYRQGQLHGEMQEWDVNGQQTTRVEYQEGRRLEKTTETYADGKKKVEGMVLQARLVMKQPDDWWEAKLATYARQGKDQKHGSWTAWYPNGQTKFTGQYQLDKPTGECNWWHENGQKSLSASYDDGRKQGVWTWWHPNGQKSIQGQYLADSPTDRWVWWHETGKVAQRVDFSGASREVSTTAPEQFDSSLMLRQPQN